MLICFTCPIDMISFHQIQKFIYLFVGNGETERQVKWCTWDHVRKGTSNLLILSPAFRESGCHKPQFFCLREGNKERTLWPSYESGSRFCSWGTAIYDEPSKNCACWNASKITLKRKRLLTNPSHFWKNVRFNPADVAETLNPGIVSLTWVHVGGEQSGSLETNIPFL